MKAIRISFNLDAGRLVRLCCLLLVCVSLPSWAQDGASQKASARDIIETEKAAEQLVEEKVTTGKRVKGDTPMSTLIAMREAEQAGDMEAAAEFLDMRYLPDDMVDVSGAELLKALNYVWLQQNILNLAEMSDDPKGHLSDGLPAYRDQVGSIRLSSGEIPIYLQRVPDGKGGKVWKISNETVAQIPTMWDELGYSPIAFHLGNFLPDFKFLGMENWQVAGTVLSFLVAWPLAALVGGLLMRLALAIPNRFPQGIERFFKLPVRIFLFLQIARLLIGELGLSLKARVLLDSSGVDYVAYTVLLMGGLSLLRDYQIRKMQYAGNVQYVALLKPFTTIVKVIVLVIIGLVWANNAGYDMTTVLAGLGVGSVAVALAAQKTVENLIGAITLYAARPVSAGDFCRFGKVTGTVEEIGLRSTLLRTLDRTMVVIPNSVFSSLQIENFSARDRIRYFRNFRIQLVGAEQLRFLLAGIRKLLLAHPRLLQDTVSVRFDNIEDANAMFRVDAGVETTDFQDFLAVAEDLNLRIVDLVLEAGATFSGPGQLMQIGIADQGQQARAAEIEGILQEWRDQDRLPFPGFSESEIAAMENTLDYPPKGAPSA